MILRNVDAERIILDNVDAERIILDNVDAERIILDNVVQTNNGIHHKHLNDAINIDVNIT